MLDVLARNLFAGKITAHVIEMELIVMKNAPAKDAKMRSSFQKV